MKDQELTAEDKQRIINKVGLTSTLEQIVFECMEKYANKKVEAERAKHKLWDDENNNLIKELGRRDEKIRQLKAEQAELRNKVIYALEELKRLRMMKDDTENMIDQFKLVDDLLTSLKTK